MKKITFLILIFFIYSLGFAQYTMDDTDTTPFVDISGTGTALGLDDDGDANVTMPFAFDLDGSSSSKIRIGNNGGLIFNATSGSVKFERKTLPTTDFVEGILPFWDDMSNASGNVYYQTMGTAPDRTFIVEWDRPAYEGYNTGSPSNGVYEVILYETSNELVFIYNDVDFGDSFFDGGADASVGIQTINDAYQYSFLYASLSDGMAIRFSPPVVLGTPPIIVCPDDIMADTDPSVCGAHVNFGNPAAIDPDGGAVTVTQTAGPVSGSVFPTGDTTIEFTAMDDQGQSSTCSFTVTVTDNEAPVAVCQNITVDLDPVTGTVSVAPEDIDNGSTDNCGIASMALNVSSFDCSMTGDNTVILTVTDDAGNASTCTSTVTVQDVTAPEITCIGSPGSVTDTVSDSPAIAIPDNTPAGVSTTITIGEDFDITDLNVNLDIAHTWVGDLIVTLQSPAGTSVTIMDRPGVPGTSVGCLNNNIDATLDDQATDPVEDECATSTSTTNPPTSWAILGSFTPNNPLSAFNGESTIGDWTLTVSDNGALDTGTLNSWGLEYSYDVSATPLDVTLDSDGMATVNAGDLIMGVNEACGYMVTTAGVTPTAGSLGTLFATNNGGTPGWAVLYDLTVGPKNINLMSLDVNTDSTSPFNLDLYTIEGGTYVGNELDPSAWGAPVASGTGTGAGTDVPSNALFGTPLTLMANTTYAIAVVIDVDVNYTDGDGSNQNYSNEDLSLSLGSVVSGLFSGSLFSPRIWNGALHYTVGVAPSSTIEFDCSDVGVNQVDIMVTDDSGNTATCTASVNVIDNTAPIITCGPTVSETASDSPALAIPDSDPVGVTSTISIGNDVSIEDLDINLDVSHTWIGDIIATITSPAGTSVTIVDRIGITTTGVGCGGDDILATLDDVATSPIESQCGTGTPSIYGTFSPNNPLAAFNGESTLGDWTITISDNAVSDTGTLNSWGITYSYASTDTDVVVELGPDGTATIDPYDIINNVDEACGIDTAAVDVTEVSCADIGTPITVTVFVSDLSGNIASCSATVMVVDNLAPEISCPGDQTVDPGGDNLFYILPDYFATGEATAVDNCTDPVTVTTQDPAPGTGLPDGDHTITLTSTDEYGNTSTCSFVLTVDTTLGNDDNALGSGVLLYPNPASSVVNLVNKSNISLSTMTIFDVNGKQVSQVNLTGMQGEKSVDVSNLAAGVYMVQIVGENARTVKRLVKE